ncbi:MAG: hypothetical protein ABF289_08305 [Clostridiales bacterium]
MKNYLEPFVNINNNQNNKNQSGTKLLYTEINIIDGMVINDSFPQLNELDMPDIEIYDPFRFFDEK